MSDTPVVLLHGARQTGKSTLVQDLASRKFSARYLTLDAPAVLSAAQTDPAGFLAGLEGPIVLDEVQRAPGLFAAIKVEVDRNRRPGRYLLTGSANVLLLPKLSESLAGRMEILPLWPLSQAEIDGNEACFIDAVFAKSLPATGLAPRKAKGGRDLFSRVMTGGYPEALARDTWQRRRAWFGSYVSTILQRDVRDLANIEGLTAMPRLLALLASRIGALENYSDLSRSLTMPQSTLKRYMALLQATFLIYPLPPWSINRGKRLVKSPKLYLTDTGLAASLLGIEVTPSAQDVSSLGSLIENFVVMELRKQSSWSRVKPEMFHFRTLVGQEVDIVLEAPSGEVVGIEVKAGKTLSTGDFKGLHSLAEQAGKKFHRGLMLYNGDEIVPFGSSMFAVPIQAIWQT